MKEKRFIIPIITGVVIFLSLFMSIVVKLDKSLDYKKLLAYISISFVGLGYSLLLELIKLKLSSKLFLIFTTLSGLYLFFAMPKRSDVFTDLAVFLSWILLIIIAIVLSLAIELIIKLINKIRHRN